MSVLLWWIIGSIVLGGTLYVTISGIITKDKLKEHLNNEGYTEAKIIELIPDKSITLTAFRNGGTETIEYSSNDGVDDALKVGNII